MPTPTSDLQRSVALAVIYGRWDGPIIDLIDQDVWDRLYEEKLLGSAGDETGESWPTITRAGEDELARLIKDAR